MAKKRRRLCQGIPVAKTIEEYREAKLEILTEDFGIILTDEELEKAQTLTTEIQIDTFCRGVISSRWRY